MTQLDVASRLGISGQTYGRWENGKTEPSLAALRDLSRVFGTSVDHLLGRNTDEPLSTNSRWIAEGEQRFWGHVGLRLPGANHTAWYPIAEGEASQLRSRLTTGPHGCEWLVIQTLNNRVLAFRPKQLQRVWLLDDASSAPSDDFMSATPLDDELIAPEMYKAMAEWVDSRVAGSQNFEENNPSDLREMLIERITRAGFAEKPDELNRVLRHTTIHFSDGQLLRYEADRRKLASLIFYLECEADLEMAEIPHQDGDFEGFYSLDMLRLIDLPLIELEAARESNDE